MMLIGVRELSKQPRVKLVTLEEPNSSFAEIYRTIRTNIEYSNIDKPVKAINITSTFANEAKTTTTCNLAVMSANKFKRVLLVDLDLRNPSVHKIFNMKNKIGFTDLLIDFVENGEDVNLETYLNKIEGNGINNQLYVLTSGTDVVNPTEILGSKKIKELMKLLASHFDQVIIDSSPSGIISDGIVTSIVADGTVFIVESGKTKIDLAQKTMEQLKNVGANILGVILTKVPVKEVPYGYYYGENHESQKRIRINVE
jgi:capsular exopolysaccharide synthesis family protein